MNFKVAVMIFLCLCILGLFIVFIAKYQNKPINNYFFWQPTTTTECNCPSGMIPDSTKKYCVYDCEEGLACPDLILPCNTQPTTTTISSQVTTTIQSGSGCPQGSTSYGSWEACQPDGNQYRTCTINNYQNQCNNQYTYRESQTCIFTHKKYTQINYLLMYNFTKGGISQNNGLKSGCPSQFDYCEIFHDGDYITGASCGTCAVGQKCYCSIGKATSVWNAYGIKNV